MEQPRYWKTLERHPLSAEYEDMTGQQWEAFKAGVQQHGIVNGRPVTLYEDKIIDGWQLQRACVELEIKPNYRELKLPKGMTADDWVTTVNELRRDTETQEYKERRAEKRRERVAAAREAGESLRAIADAEGVSKITVTRDLAGGPPVHLPPKIQGKDGKSYAATEAKQLLILCDRCKRIAPVPGCNACKAARDADAAAKKKKAATKRAEPTEAVDAFGTPIPKGCKDAWSDPWIQNTFDALTVFSEDFRKARMADGMKKRAKAYPYFNSKDFIDGCGFVIDYLDHLIKHLKENRPAGVCPACEGKKCVECLSSGLVPRTVHAKLKKAAS